MMMIMAAMAIATKNNTTTILHYDDDDGWMDEWFVGCLDGESVHAKVSYFNIVKLYMVTERNS